MEDILQRYASFALSPGTVPEDVRMRMRAVLGVTIVAPEAEGFIGCAGAPAAITALAEGARLRRTMHEVERAQIIAAELSLRLWLVRPHTRCAPAIAGAAAAGLIFGLDRERMTQALALALPGSTRLHGVHAAERALLGARGPIPWGLSIAPQLGETWLARRIVVHAHDAPAGAQSAIDATREVIAQARHVRGALVSDDVRALVIDTSLVGLHERERFLDAIAALGVPRSRIELRHALDLTLAAWSRLGNRAHLITRDGQRFSADRSEPDLSTERMLAIARGHMIHAGLRDVYEELVHPRGRTAPELIAMISRLRRSRSSEHLPRPRGQSPSTSPGTPHRPSPMSPPHPTPSRPRSPG